MFFGTWMVSILPLASFSSISRVSRSTDWTVVVTVTESPTAISACARAPNNSVRPSTSEARRLRRIMWLLLGCVAIKADPAARAKCNRHCVFGQPVLETQSARAPRAPR